MICNQCGEENRGYHNYCLNDGKGLKNINKKNILNSIKSGICISCNSDISKYSNYCNECGSIQSQITQKKSIVTFNEDKNKIKNNIKVGIGSVDINTKKVQSFTNNISTDSVKKNIVNIDIKQSIFMALIIIFGVSIVASIINSIYINELQSLGMYEINQIPKGKIFLLSIVSYNIPRLLIDLKMEMMSVASYTVSTGGLIGPLVIIISAIISSCILTKKDKIRENMGLNAMIVAGFYSIMIFLLAFLSSTNIMIEEGATLSIKVDNFIGLFISSFIISFIGTYIGMYIKSKENRSIYSRLFISSGNIILGGLFATTVITYVILSLNNTNTPIGYIFTELIPDEYWFRVLTSIAAATWIFISLNFSSINFMDIEKYSILDLGDLISPSIILVTIIPIVCLLIKGRAIKYEYQEENALKVVTIFSGIYSLIIGAVAFATTLYMSFNSTVVDDFLSGMMYEMSYMFEYIYPGFMENYITPIYNSLGNGITIGPSMIGAIMGSFIFSFIFVFIGYKTNTKTVKEGEM